MAESTTILAVRINPAVKTAIGLAARKHFISVPEYRDAVTADGGFERADREPEPKVPAGPLL